ncbi:hypothetical protein [Stieleria neptunia]|nr:hypothetical protein [Stieleria neptunia]
MRSFGLCLVLAVLCVQASADTINFNDIVGPSTAPQVDILFAGVVVNYDATSDAFGRNA